MNITTNREYRWHPTTDEFTVRVIRELTEQEIDPEVGPMYEVVAHAYVDELSLPQPTGTGLLGEVIEILYPLDGFRDDQWNGGDVCEALAAVIDKYAPWAKTRQPEHDDTIPTCDICGIPEEGSTLTWNGDTGCHVECERVRDAQAGWQAYKAERNRLGI